MSASYAVRSVGTGRLLGAVQRSLCTLLLVTHAAPLSAQETASDTLLTVQHYLDWEAVADPQLSPDGRQVVYTRRYVNKIADRWDNEVWLMEADGSRKRFLTRGSAPRWSPDGTRIAYLAPGEPSGSQIFVRWMDAEGATSQVTRVVQSPSHVRWSPDGRSLAFTMLVPTKSEGWSISMPSAPQGASWTKAPRIVERAHYRQDFRGFSEAGYVHLFVVPADGGAARQLTSGEWNVGARPVGLDFGVGVAWTPDSRTLVFDGLMADDADLRYLETHLYSVDVTSGQIRQITSRKGPWGDPHVSPDGRLIAFTGYDWTPQTYKSNELWLIALDGSNARRIAPNIDDDALNLHWAPDGRGLYITLNREGSRNVWHAPVNGSAARQLTEGAHMITLTSVARNGSVAGLITAPHEPVNVLRFDVRRPAQLVRLTRTNAAILDRVRLGEVEEVWYRSADGTRVQGWIVTPADFDPSHRYPLIMEIHGGPHAMYNVGFSYMYQNFAANGYVVLYTNPRGSTGYGTDFGNAIDNAYPSVDYDDLIAGVDAVVARGFIDTDRMYVGGCSGGGVLSSWMIGKTDRFAAAAVRCPVSNWISFAGTTDITIWGFNRFRSLPWDDPAKWLEHSPLMLVGAVKTPTLVMTGELDLRTPMAQSEEYYQALKLLGVPTALVRFEGEYHGTGTKPSNFMRTQLYMMSWYQRWTKRGERVSERVSEGES
jgi:dipeptidyl aminopeptidase/acylaminoacyl peptidase